MQRVGPLDNLTHAFSAHGFNPSFYSKNPITYYPGCFFCRGTYRVSVDTHCLRAYVPDYLGSYSRRVLLPEEAPMTVLPTMYPPISIHVRMFPLL